ncbi:MAG TPA: hypothetical protein VF528_20310 [Pyrinomonadaceae bacterium]|jgi:hypothetical protein
MNTLTRFALVTVIAHAAVATLHGAAHQRLGVGLSTSQSLFVIVVITIAPIVAAILLWKKLPTAGAVILTLSMAGSLLFGVYNHFVGISPDHVSNVAAMSRSSWVSVFQSTAFLLPLTEAAGTIAGIFLLKRDSGILIRGRE